MRLQRHAPSGAAVSSPSRRDSGRTRYQHRRLSVADTRWFSSRALLTCTAEADIQLCLSANIYSEYEEVIRRPKFKRGELEIDGILGAIRKSCIWVKPTDVLRVCLDPDYDIFLECAQAADAHYLVTGNTRHFPESWRQAQVVTARQFVEDITGTRM